MRVDRSIELEPSARPPWGAPPGVGFSERLVERLLADHTIPGDVVLDPFVGFGTTIVVADRMGRRGIGVELLAERVEHVRGLVARPSDVHVGDARDLEPLNLPRCDASLSSPPYRPSEGHPEDPLDGYRSQDAASAGRDGYERYLLDLVNVYGGVADRVRKGGTVLIDVATLALDGVVTDLAGDLAEVLAATTGVGLELVEAVEVVGEEPASWMVADIVLVLRSTGSPIGT